MTDTTYITFHDRLIAVKRDDLYPIAGGGNKGRKLSNIFKSDVSTKCRAIITNGGVQSNHARVCALMAVERGMEAHIVLHGDPSALLTPEGNLLLALMAGAQVYIVDADEIASTIQKLESKLSLENKFPHVIPGGAHCLSGALAYADAISELGSLPDVIVLASGTGATHAGILAGLDMRGGDTRVYGISVARRNPRGGDVVRASYIDARIHLNLTHLPEREVIFDDRWMAGGYDQTSPEIFSTISAVARKTGMILDPTYTGKAFWGMLELIGEGAIKKDESVLFWHTGGLLNALSSVELKNMGY